MHQSLASGSMIRLLKQKLESPAKVLLTLSYSKNMMLHWYVNLLHTLKLHTLNKLHQLSVVHVSSQQTAPDFQSER